MRKPYNDFTAETATSTADKEFRSMARLALALRRNRRNPAWEEGKEKEFTGIYKRLLTDPIEEVSRIAGQQFDY